MQSDLREALETLRQGGPASTERALLYIQRTVFSFSLKLCGNRADAEDTMQETLVQVLPYLRRFESPDGLAVWLYKTAKTRCMMSRRRSKFAPSHELSLEHELAERGDAFAPAESPTKTPEAVAIRAESNELLHRAVLKLPRRYRVVLVLHDMEGFTTSETARVLNLQQGAVRVRLHRARMQLRREFAIRHRLKAEGDEPALPPRCQKLSDELSEFLDRRMADALCRELARHLETCEQCHSLLESLERMVARCRQFQAPAVDPAVAARHREILLREYGRILEKVQQRKRRSRGGDDSRNPAPR